MDRRLRPHHPTRLLQGHRPSRILFSRGGGASNRIATLRDWTVQLSGGVEYHYSSSVMIRDFNSGKTALELKEAQGYPVIWSRDGRAIAASEGRGRDRMGIWDARTGARLGRVISHIDTITHAAFTPEGNIVTLSRDGTVRLTDPLTSRTISRLEVENSTNPRALSVSPDGRTVTSIWGTIMHIWRPHESCLTSHNLNSVRRTEGWPLCISPDGRYLACRTEDGFDITEVISGALLYEQQIGGGGHIVTAADFSSDGKVLLLGRMNGDVQVWDIQERKV
ncbi:putative WD repeat-containing protein [Cladobotryum mycophilum]|uniref:WD repeat-containing protein n=1 Tax=Cladobotryum mycophilum TaxID=491253 RepID=A0ABR0SCJ5_9HYPO